MKRFKQHIKEALDKPYPLKKHSYKGRGDRAISYTYTFQTDSNLSGEINMEMDEDGEANVDFNIDDSMSMTGGGDQFRIFATVAKAMDEFLRKEKPDSLEFVGSKDGESGSRQKLYSRFIKKLGKKYGYEVEIYNAIGSSAKVFNMHKPLKEASDKQYIDASDLDVISYIIKNGDGYPKDMKGKYSTQKITRVAKKYNGVKTRIGIMVYMGGYSTTSGNGPFATQGQAGYGGRVDAEIAFLPATNPVAKIARKEFEKNRVINEEWVTQNDWVGDMFKNPSPRELSEYLKTANQFSIAGIVADGDIYVFDGMHDDGFEEIRKHKNGYPRKAFRWRAIVKGGKLASLGPSGGDPLDYYGVSKETRETLFKDMAAVYNNKYLKSRMGTYDQAFGEVIRAFMRFSKMEEQEVFAELEQLKKKYKVK